MLMATPSTHSSICLLKGDFKDLQGEHLSKIQQALTGMEYLIIDEMSMVGRKMFGQVDRMSTSGVSSQDQIRC